MLFVAVNVAILLLSAGYTYYTGKKEMDKAERKARETAFEQAESPVVDASSSIPILYGSVLITGANVVWSEKKYFSDPMRFSGGGSSGKPYTHELLHYVLCQKADYFHVLQFDGVPSASPSAQSLLTGPVLHPVPVSVNGGIGKYSGTDLVQLDAPFQLLPGLPSQDTPVLFQEYAPSKYLRTGETGEAYRGVVSLVVGGRHLFGDGRWLGVKYERTDRLPDMSIVLSHTGGYEIGPLRAANPAWIIEDILTNPYYGLGINPAKINGTSFYDARQILDAEGFGLCFLITDQTPAREFIDEVLRHIDGVLYTNRTTGQIEIKLIREELAPRFTIDEDYIRSVVAYQQPDSKKLPTHQVIFYNKSTYSPSSTDPRDIGWKTRRTTAEAHDTAGTYTRGIISAQPKDFPGIIDPDLAYRVAQRELRTESTPRANIEIEVNGGIADDLYQGDTIGITWSELGLDNAIFRVLSVDLGTHTDSTARITAIEDIFAFEEASIAEEPRPPAEVVAPIEHRVAIELPYWLRKNNVNLAFEDFHATTWYPPPPIDWPATQPEDPMMYAKNGVVSTFATLDGGSPAYRVSRAPDFVRDMEYETAWVLEYPVNQFDDYGVSKGNYSTFVDAPEGFFSSVDPQTGTLFMLWHEDVGHEFLTLRRYYSSDKRLVLHRGMIDTPNLAFPAGAVLFRIGQNWKLDSGEPIDKVGDLESVSYSFQAMSESGALSADNAFLLTGVKRSFLPLPPVDIDVSATPTQLIFTWKYRDRLLEPRPYFVSPNEPKPTGVTFRTITYGVDASGALLPSPSTSVATGLSFAATRGVVAARWPTATRLFVQIYTLSTHESEPNMSAHPQGAIMSAFPATIEVAL